jgi:ADP-ribosylglycohydrolase
MRGAIAGDVIGSIYEADNVKTPGLGPLFSRWSAPTDDTVLTCAVAEWVLHGAGDDLPDRLKAWFRCFPNAGYGGTFCKWAMSSTRSPYNSWGNGSAMRVSPVGFACDSLRETMELARRSADVTHNHPEGIRGAQAVAGCIFLARTHASKQEIREFASSVIGYDLTRCLAEIRPAYGFDVSCQGSVPQAITAFLESDDWEDAIRKAISLGGDSDTIACMTGGIAATYYGSVPAPVWAEVEARMAPQMRAIVSEFLLSFPSAS